MIDVHAAHRWGSFTGIAAVLAMTLGGQVQAAPDQPSDLIAKGKYLADVGDCAACHTAGGGQRLAGGREIPTPFGPIPSPNITPDKDTGIGNWTDDQFYHALHDGIDDKGAHLYPVMPFPWYTKVTREDVLAIKAYLFSLEPVHSPSKPNKLAFPFNIRAGLAVWDEMFLRKGEFTPDSSKSGEINRGAYIVQGLGHCGACHNGRAMLGDTRMAAQLQGGAVQNWYAPNLTNDVHDGIGRYSDDQVVAYLKTGVAPGMGVATGPMLEAIQSSLHYLTDADLHAIVAYLKSTNAEPSYAVNQRSDFTGQNPVGRQAYLDNCASCHQLNGQGIPDSVPSLVGNGAVLAEGSEDVIRVVLGGIVAHATYAPMPAAATGMTDQQVADVTNYVRQSWGNQAPPNAGAGKVGTLRASTYTAMNIGPDGHCSSDAQPDLMGVIKDSSSGIAEALHSMTQETVLQTAAAIVRKVKAAAPQAQQADIVNSLTAAYCPIVAQDSSIPANLKVSQLDQFSERVYSELRTGGKE